MTIYISKVHLVTETRPTFHDVTEEATRALAESNVKNGLITVFSPHTTCSVLIQEPSGGKTFNDTFYIMQDLVNCLAKIVPTCTDETQYLHPGRQVEEKHGIGDFSKASLNTDAHIRSVIMGRSVCVPVIDGEIQLGRFGHIWFADFDQVRARERECLIQVMGE